VIARFSRWLVVVVTAWGLRRDIPHWDMFDVLTRALPHRELEWRCAVLDDAQFRNIRKAARRG